ncbi:MAG TPA: low molecular weight protein-tyrosine-phosphatase [Noviherbaspirillum sp.]|uniref:low molecular weight protein-tyrosine-phosphatase n=1 Tax=Noviherbaspirillum sp. TaxID=1926288 RepID=UPI002F941FDE
MKHNGRCAVLFVCMGNICRSPTAEAVMRKYLVDAGLANRVIVDSAGTHDYHVGCPPDPRAQAAARKRGYDLSALRARQVTPADFEAFDLVLGMDFNNLDLLQRMCPPQHRGKLGLLMAYAQRHNATVVHDPYYRGSKDFDTVLSYIEDGCKGLMQSMVAHGALLG